MSKRIPLKLSADGTTKNVEIQFSPELQDTDDGGIKSSVVFFTLFIDDKEVKIFETSFDALDKFCLELSAQHKNIMNNHK